MSAVNPLEPSAATGGDQRSYEPTMEEILASIRRIIADDQSVAAARTPTPEPHYGHQQAEPPREPQQASLHVLHAEPTPHHEPAPAADEPSFDPTDMQDWAEPEYPDAPQMMAHGHVAAPQFPMPEPAAAAPADAMPIAESVEQQLSSVAPQHEPGPAHEDRMVLPLPEPPAPPPPTPEPPMPEPQHMEPSSARANVHETRMDRVDDPAGSSQAGMQLFSAQTKQSVASAFTVLAAARLADNSEELLAIARDMIRPMLKTWLDDNLPSMVERLVRAEIERVARGR